MKPLFFIISLAFTTNAMAGNISCYMKRFQITWAESTITVARRAIGLCAEQMLALFAQAPVRKLGYKRTNGTKNHGILLTPDITHYQIKFCLG